MSGQERDVIDGEPLDLLVVGAGPTGLGIGAEARRAGLRVLLVDRGALCASIIKFPSGMGFFTTRDLLEIAGVPFGVPEDKPNRRQALAYYQGVARQHQIPLALYEEVVRVRREGELFCVESRGEDGPRLRRARAVALASGYFEQPRRLGVEGEELPWVHRRYREPYLHFGQHVVVVGGGNSAAEAALDMWRNGVRVTLVHRRSELKKTVKYWVKPDLENRIAEGSIEARLDSVVTRFTSDREVEIETPSGRELLPADAAYVMVGYLPDAELERRCGVALDPETLVPVFDPETCESNVPGLYVAGTLQVGLDIGKLFIENTREHGGRIVRHLASQIEVRAAARGAV